MVGVKDRELPEAASLQASVSLVGTEPADLRKCPSAYSQVHSGAQLGMMGLGGSSVSPGFLGPSRPFLSRHVVDRGQASPTRASRLPCHPDPAMPCPGVSSPRWPPLSRVTPRPGLGRLQTGEARSGPALGWGPAHRLQVLSAANLLRFLGVEGPDTPRGA